MITNAIKRAIADGRSIRGFHQTFPAPAIIELMVIAGMDYVYLDGEHGAFDNRDLEHACVAAERHGVTAIARVPDPSPATICRFLDRGVQGIVVPHVESVHDARAVIDAAYFAPLGNRSFGAGRPLFQAGIRDMDGHFTRANDEICVSIMIETRAAFEAAGEIAALPGIDYMSFGLMDFAQSLGHPGNPGHPEVTAAVADASERIRRAGKPVREDFIIAGWINDIIIKGAQTVFGERADG
jgi:4-hydroxy-2-oxoheptanedioate aldolase